MVQANDLRVGNRFVRELHNQRGLEYDKDFILTEKMMGKLFSCSSEFSLNDLFPIEITDEVLVSCGFDWDIFYQAFTNGQYVVSLLNDGKITFSYCKRKHDDFQFLPFIKYLHQLQNIHYAVTGREINVQMSEPKAE